MYGYTYRINKGFADVCAKFVLRDTSVDAHVPLPGQVSDDEVSIHCNLHAPNNQLFISRQCL